MKNFILSCALVNATLICFAGLFFNSTSAIAGMNSSSRTDSSPQVAQPNVDCSNLPQVNPNKTFIGNFGNSCYMTPLTISNGAANSGDLNARYYNVYYQVNPGYELVLTGAYPNARFFSVEVYDSHSVSVAALLDSQIVPLNSSFSDPFAPGASYVAGQQYGIRIGLGGVPPQTPSPGCSTAGSNLDSNFADASQIHQGLTWSSYSPLPDGFPTHQTGLSSGGSIMVRYYAPFGTQTVPAVIVRDLSTGCAVPLAQVSGLSVVTTNKTTGPAWANSSQVSAHNSYAGTIQPQECYPKDPGNGAQWLRAADYVPGYDTFASYLSVSVSASSVSTIVNSQEFIRIQFHIPTYPNTPCAMGGGCAITGNEQVRYRSITFASGTTSLASIKDSDMVVNPGGYVTLIIGMGTQPPANVTAANYYTYFDLSTVPNYQTLTNIQLRDILPNTNFQCSSFNVPYKTTEYNPNGGYMGDYVPTVDYPTTAKLPTIPNPPVRADTCSIVPTQPPTTCPAS